MLCKLSSLCQATPLNCVWFLLQLYTSGSTGKPKGVLHTTAGYMMGAGEAVAAWTLEWHRQSLCAAWLSFICSALISFAFFQTALLPVQQAAL